MITVVIPTIGRRSLRRLLAALGPDVDTIVVDDRPRFCPSLAVPPHVRVLRTGGRGPAAARNAGWRAASTQWVAFLDDDVLPPPGWTDALLADLCGLAEDVAGSQGRLTVPLPAERRPTDAERNTAALMDAGWATADMAYRRDALEAVGGFDERFPRAYREDADLALRLLKAGYGLVKGKRTTEHPVRDDGFWTSVRAQRGNADDALMRRLHGPGWRTAIGGAPGRLALHALTSALGLAACALFVVGSGRGREHTRPGRAGTAGSRVRGAHGAASGVAGRAPAAAAGLGWLVLTTDFVWARVAPGPRTPAEVLRMAVTSVVIPPVACVHRLRGELRARR
ncbi:glycosyltransferase [Sphaerisporangium album]|uniref:Glycosyltransferase n=1 Tax=Sphaerisporangium album TaxID=509200 RepID=A0A367FIR5_9ACTN|nr:glycosyltransferase [Sphaerisporangium album]RCG30256.1 glycosyltransferase [Sphaerisporangium album]